MQLPRFVLRFAPPALVSGALVSLALLSVGCGRGAEDAGSSGSVGDGTYTGGFGGAFWQGLSSADRVEIFALHPFPEQPEGMAGTGERTLGGYRVLNSTVMHDQVRRGELMAAVSDGVKASDGRVARCFSPRHGVRVHQGRDRFDLIICYECLTIQVLGPGGARGHVPTADGVEPLVSRLFRAEGLALHDDPQSVHPVTEQGGDEPLPAAVTRILRQAEDFEVLALDPVPVAPGASVEGEIFRGHEVLGRQRLLRLSEPESSQGVGGPSLREQLLQYLMLGIRESEQGALTCFAPGHAIRAGSGDQAVELMISYACRSVRVYGPGVAYYEVPTGAHVEPTVSRIFRNIGAPIPE